MATERRQYYSLITLILSLTITSTIYGAEPAFVDANAPGSAPGILRIPPGHPYRFNADPTRSQIVVTANVSIFSDNDTSPVSGWLDITLTPGQAPFSTINITDLDLDLTEQIDLRFGILGSATGTDIGVTMYSPGPAAPVQLDDSFIQTDSYLSARGIFAYNIMGNADTVDLSTLPPQLSDLPGLVRQDWTTITLQANIDIVQPIEVDGTELGTARIQGTVIATAEVFWAPADLFSDGLVNFKDFAVFAAAWPYTLGDPQYNPDCDLQNPPDGLINAKDLVVFAESWLAPIN